MELISKPRPQSNTQSNRDVNADAVSENMIAAPATVPVTIKRRLQIDFPIPDRMSMYPQAITTDTKIIPMATANILNKTIFNIRAAIANIVQKMIAGKAFRIVV
jgi:hypothetical protein